MKDKWYYNVKTKKEVHSKEKPEGDEWKLGRLPSRYWSEERKNSYKEKRKNVVWTEEYRKKQSERTKRYQTDRVGYTNGKKNIWLRIGQDIPKGFYKGWTIDDPIKYCRKEVRQCLEQLMEGLL